MQTLGYWTLRVAVWRWLLLVDPRVFWAPGPAVGPGCAVGGPPASCPRHKLRSTLRLVIRPGPSAQLWLPTSNSARNSSMTHSNIEFASLELQRFWGVSKNDRDKLRAKFGWRWCQRLPLRPSLPRAIGASARCPARPHRPRAPQPTGTAARVHRSPVFRSRRRHGQAPRFLQHPSCRRRWGFCTT